MVRKKKIIEQPYAGVLSVFYNKKWCAQKNIVVGRFHTTPDRHKMFYMIRNDSESSSKNNSCSSVTVCLFLSVTNLFTAIVNIWSIVCRSKISKYWMRRCFFMERREISLFLLRITHNAVFLCLVAHKALDKPLVTVKKNEGK